MCSILKNHPFAVRAFFDYSVVLTFAFPKEQLMRLIPECLSLDTFKDKFAFVAVAVVKTTGLRPDGFPGILGCDFLLIGYRIFVQYTNNAGKRLRGLYILKSETNRKLMESMGNIFTHYGYTLTDINVLQDSTQLKIISRRSNLTILLETETKQHQVDLPPDSPFNDWKEARRFAGPLPFTFSYNSKKQEVLIIEGVRENWTPKAAKVLKYQMPYLEAIGLGGGVLANAFIINDVPYFWKKGKREKWNG